VQHSDARKIYHQMIGGEVWSAIQITTAAGICAVVDLHREGRLPSRGFVRQEQISLTDYLANRFGRHYLPTTTGLVPVDVLRTEDEVPK
jgi:saccharopine dehydrogenase-like NADP-dependent oxidoreductase